MYKFGKWIPVNTFAKTGGRPGGRTCRGDKDCSLQSCQVCCSLLLLSLSVPCSLHGTPPLRGWEEEEESPAHHPRAPSHAVPISLLSHLYVCVLPQKCYSGCGSGTLELLYQAQQPQPCEEAPDHGSTMVLLTLQCVPLSWAHIQSMRCAENWLPDSRIGCKAAEGRHQILIKEDVGENKMHVEHEYLIFLFLWFVLWWVWILRDLVVFNHLLFNSVCFFSALRTEDIIMATGEEKQNCTLQI